MNQADRAKLRALVAYLQSKIKDERWRAQQYEKQGDERNALIAQGAEVGFEIALRQLASAFNIPIDLEQEEQS